MLVEKRLHLSELPRIEARAGKEYITGRAIVFNQWSKNLGGFQEMILRSAVDGADMSNILVKFNHDINFTLGRTTTGTAGYSITPEGVDYWVEYDAADPDHQKVRRKIERGDCEGSSFEFTIAEGGENWVKSDTGMWQRTVSQFAKVYDFAPVIDPAYSQTSTTFGSRSLNEYLESRGICVEIKIKEEDCEEEDGGDMPATGETEQDGCKPKMQRNEQPAVVEPSVSAVPLSIYKRKLQLAKAGI